MPDTKSQPVERFTILCRRCDRPVLAREAWVGWEVQCPHCYSLMRVPAVPADRRPVLAEGPHLSTRHGFNFACPCCDCVLEAHTGMSGQLGTCPTCGTRFNIPYLRGRSGRPEPARVIEGEAQDPVPLHAYAASGYQAPQIVRRDDGTAVIECPRCNAHSPIDADTCVACGTPFTMEAAPTMARLRRDTRATSSVTLGVVGLVLFPLMLPGLIAVWLGLRSVMFAGPGRRSGVGLAGLTLGLLSLIAGAAFWLWKLM
jgi:hypothetical protein